MSISLQDENDLMEMIHKFKQTHRVRNTLVIIMTDKKTIIDPLDRKTFKKLTSEASYGIGFADGRNDYYKELAHNKKIYTKRLDISY